MKWFIQIDNEGIVNDETTLNVLDAIKFENWYRQKQVHSYKLVTLEQLDICGRDGIPVGSIEFVERFMGKNIQPIDIPEELLYEIYTARKVCIGTYDECKHLIDKFSTKKIFIKSHDKLKEMTDLVTKQQIENIIHKESVYVFSEDIEELHGEILGEYRVFVFNDVILDCRRYSGEWTAPRPNETTLQNMVKAYSTNTSHSSAYTLDVAITSDGSIAVIEVHNMISCGLYGFSDKLLLKMIKNAYEFESSRRLGV